MENAVYIGLSRQMALRDTMDARAHNIANMNTPGFRAQQPIFAQHMASIGGGQEVSMVSSVPGYMTMTPGAMRRTGEPLHAAIVGPGFFGAQAPDGSQAYTRAGNFQRAADGTLITAGGAQVSSQGGGAIVIPARSTNLTIDEGGTISNQDGKIAQLMIVEFDDAAELRPLGATLYASDTKPAPAEKSKVAGGTVESSNVNPIQGMTEMVDVLRSYQSLQNILQQENERMRSMISTLTKQG